ncbi:MAG: hypothetical protein ACE15D_16640 [Candidatus Eisenbacteria bacterium]|nr:hypothetical protein [Candidatus Eisenbacteria bacterium]
MVARIVIAAAALSLTLSTVFAAVPADLQPLAFLLGEWQAEGSGAPGLGTGTATFTTGLQDRVILRNSYAEYPEAEGRAASRHDDLMAIYAAPGGARADYYDSEGHVIRYLVQSPAAGQAIFLSEAAPGQPRFRLSYALDDTGELKGGFAISPPDAPDAFKPYLTWGSRKTPQTTR